MRESEDRMGDNSPLCFGKVSTGSSPTLDRGESPLETGGRELEGGGIESPFMVSLSNLAIGESPLET
jgi:hypothetical protein